jgi:hypothetical protein
MLVSFDVVDFVCTVLPSRWLSTDLIKIWKHYNCTPDSNYQDDQINDHETDRTCSTHDRHNKYIILNSPTFWDITPCSPLKVNRRFGEKCRLHLQDRSRAVIATRFHADFSLALFFNSEDGGDMFL